MKNSPWIDNCLARPALGIFQKRTCRTLTKGRCHSVEISLAHNWRKSGLGTQTQIRLGKTSTCTVSCRFLQKIAQVGNLRRAPCSMARICPDHMSDTEQERKCCYFGIFLEYKPCMAILRYFPTLCPAGKRDTEPRRCEARDRWPHPTGTARSGMSCTRQTPVCWRPGTSPPRTFHTR